jgi:peptide/nickel transport system ATP-binding protein
MTLLDVDKLRVTFATEGGQDVIAVKEVSFSLNPGEILAIVGESGCGKSVTAMSIAALHPPEGVDVEGTIRLRGVDMSTLGKRELEDIRGSQISVVFQEPMTSLNPAYTVGYQIVEVLRRHEKMSRRAARSKAIDLLRLVDIPDPGRRFGSFPHELSGGMRQRVVIAIAVACNPRILIADEPTTALDVTIQAGILDVIRRLRDELDMAVILITHDLAVVAELADRVIVMYAGRPVEIAGVEELFAHPLHHYTGGLLKALPSTAVSADGRRRLMEIPGMVPLPVTDPDLCQFHERCPAATEQCTSRRPELKQLRPGHHVACYHPTDTPMAGFAAVLSGEARGEAW